MYGCDYIKTWDLTTGDVHMRNMAIILFFLVSSLVAASAHGALVYGYAGQNLVQDTSTGLIWVPPSSDSDQLSELSAYGSNLRIATNSEVGALLNSANFDAAGVGDIDPSIVEFIDFLASGNIEPQSNFCQLAGVDTQPCVSFFAWSLGTGGTEQVPLSTYNFTGNVFAYASDLDQFTWQFTQVITLGTYPIDPCDTSLFSACTNAAFRIMDPVPLPGAVWLMLSGLLGLLGYTKVSPHNA